MYVSTSRKELVKMYTVGRYNCDVAIVIKWYTKMVSGTVED